ncbi:MAG: efflux RND transporter permease subunit, partial [candidate division Zixibacteria bacterium]|nr:efflux RND transporter permease subunit [candidate division Zixibacteria bacterium]
MILADISIRRPVFAVMMAGALLVLGITPYFALSVDLCPKMDLPYVVVSVVYPGAGAEAVELDVTKKVEDAVNTIAGVKHISSTAQEGYSLTVIEFAIESDPLNDAAEVRDKVSSIRGDLPTDIEDPVIQRYDMQSEPIISLSISGRQSMRDLTDYADDIIRPRLESISGVGAAELVGGAEREIQVRVNPEKLKALDLTPLMVAAKLQAANIEVPGGRVADGDREWVVRTMGRFTTVQQIRDLVVLSPKGRMVRMSEIAEVIDTEVEPTSASRLNGEPAVGLDIRRQSGANTVDVANGINAELEKIKADLPAGMTIVTASDNSEFIRDAIKDVLVNIIWGGLLAILVILLFLANWRSTIISAVAIPISIIATFTLMRALGFTLNMITLMGLSLAVGLLIDDAIVVIENIYRHMETGKKPMQAAHDATDEIGMAVSATTFAIIVVFLPVAFMSGIIGRIFNSFGLTVAFAVTVSLFIAFTLTPMLSSRFFRPHEEQIETRLHRGLKWWDRGFRHIEQAWYRPALHWCLDHRLTTVALAGLTLVGSLMLIPVIGTEFMPTYDQGFVYVTFEGQAGDRLSTTIENMKPVEKLIMAYPEVASILTTIGGGTDPVHAGTISIKLTDQSERKVTAMDLVKTLRGELRSIPGYFFTTEIEQGHAGNRPISLSIRGPELKQLELYTENLADRIRNIPGVADLKSSQEAGKPELRVNIDRDRAVDLGVNIMDAAQTVQIFIDGKKVTRFKEG